MSNEITVTANLQASKGSVNAAYNLSGLQFNMTGTKAVTNVMTIATSATALNLGDIVSVDSSTPGWILIFNMDATNYVTFRNGSGGADLIKILPGEFALFRLATATPFALANTAAVQIQYLVIET